MSETPVGSITKHFGQVVDPRVERTKHHQLLDIITIAICAVICGADDWVEVEQFGKDKLDWFRTFLSLPNGIPSHDTFGDVFARIDPDEFQRGFLSWVQTIAQLLPGEVIAIDGKTLRRSHNRSTGKHAIHMVSAWASSNRLVLGQVKVAEKSNEMRDYSTATGVEMPDQAFWGRLKNYDKYPSSPQSQIRPRRIQTGYCV